MATKISFVKASLLTNVVGRVDYISNPKRQENLFAFYQTPEDPMFFWKELSNESQARSNYHKNAKKVVEAREHIITLPYEFMEESPQTLAQRLALKFKTKHGVDCAVAIHLNSAKTNYHAHLIFSERVLLNDQRVSIASRNTYFDAAGKRSTKAKCLGADGKLLPGCRMVQKGETFPVKHFSGKNGTFASRTFLKAEKQRYAEYFTQKTNDRWEVYSYNTNPHIQLLNLVRGENESLRAWKEAENAKRKQYNAAIDRAIDAGELTLEQAINLKKQVYLEIAEAREKRAAERELWKRWFDEFPERRAAWVEQRRKEWEKLHYNSFGMRRSIFELTVILAFTVVGVDVLKNNIDDNLMVNPPARSLKANVDPKLQEMIDQLCIAAGRKVPSEQLAERKMQKFVNVYEHKPSLSEQIGGAEIIRKNQHEAGEVSRVFSEKDRHDV